MRTIKSLFISLCLTVTLFSCSSLKEAGDVLRNEKTKSTDEFLINKKDPLTQPPDFDSIPKPGSVTDSKAEKNSIEKILKTSNTKSSKAQSKPSSTEDSILRQIKK